MGLGDDMAEELLSRRGCLSLVEESRIHSSRGSKLLVRRAVVSGEMRCLGSPLGVSIQVSWVGG
jgi:hypothetical protein